MPIAAGQLRDRIRFERRHESRDGFGNVEGAWRELVTVWARVQPKPTGRDETVQAGRLAGLALYAVTIRSSAATRAVTPGDRAVIVTDGGPLPAGTALNIRFVGDLDARRAVLSLDAELGAPT